MSKRFPHLLIQDMLSSIRKIQNNTQALSDDIILADEWMCDAIIRNMEIIGEAANQLPETLHLDFPTIPWRQIVGFRNRVIHEYAQVDMVLVLEIIRDELPKLQAKLSEILKQLKP